MISPDKCLRRWCRVCAREMSLDYDFDDEDRVYDFCCARCGILVRIFEAISQQERGMLERKGCLLEPLTKEEQEEQRGLSKREAIFREYHPRNDRQSQSKSVLDPVLCLKRQCRICEKETELEYKFSSKERWYTFYCTQCKTTVQVLEEIIEEMRECYMQDGYPVEPLTKEEKALQRLGDGTMQTVGKRRIDLTKENKVEYREKHKLSKEETEKLR